MKRSLYSGLTCKFILSVLPAFLGCIDATALQLASQGHTKYTIVLPDQAIPAEVTGAAELANHLKQISGADFPVIHAADYTAGPMIAVGFNGKLPERLGPQNFPGLGPEELVIAADGDMLLLGGGRPRGSLYAVYEFLEGLGVRWYTPQETFIPNRPELDVEIKPLRYASPFYSRTQVAGNGETPQWCARNRLNSFREWGNPGEEYGGGVLQGPGMESFFIYLKKADMDRHPEWLAEVNGRREASAAGASWGVCLSNPALRAELVKRALDWARKHPDATAVWLAQNDGSPYCTCAACKTFYEAHGGQPSSLIVLLLNELAEKVKAEFPDMRVKTLAYSWSVTPPENMKLADNVTVMLCAGIDHRATLGRSPESEKIVSLFQRWRKIASDFEVYLYGYPHDDYFAPSPCLYSQARNIHWAAENGIRSIHHQFFGFYNSKGGDLVYLRLWLYTKLAWNPNLDVDSLVEDFCNNYYGDAGPVLQNAIREYSRKVESGDLTVNERDLPFLPNYVEVELAQKLSKELEEHYQTMKDPVFRKRFAYAILPMLWADYWSGLPSLCRYDSETKTWGIPVTDRDRRGRLGKWIRQIMIDNDVSMLGERKGFNPAHLRLDELVQAYPAFELADDRLQVVVVPACYGKMVEFQSREDGFNPIKPAWGNVIMQYPRFGYWNDYYNGLTADRMTVTSSSPSRLEMQCRRADGTAFKTLELNGGTLVQTWKFVPKENTDCRIKVCPLLDLGEKGFGIYPVLRVGLKSGEWREVELGKAGFFWYQGGKIDLTDFNGTLLLVSEDKTHTLELKMDPAQTAQLTYMYDRYDCKPEGTNRILELQLQSIVRTTPVDTPFAFSMSMRISK